jgi:hypothetical protein
MSYMRAEARYLLWVEIQVCAIHLVESPEKILGRSVYIVAARVIWEVVAQRGARELLSEEIDLVQEEDDACPHKPSRIDHGVE